MTFTFAFFFVFYLLGTVSKLIHLVHNSEFPYTSFAALETGTCLVADSGFDSLMVKLKTFYAPRKAAKIQVRRRDNLNMFELIYRQVLWYHYKLQCTVPRFPLQMFVNVINVCNFFRGLVKECIFPWQMENAVLDWLTFGCNIVY